MKLKAKRVSHSFWLNLATKARAYFKKDQPLINYLINLINYLINLIN